MAGQTYSHAARCGDGSEVALTLHADADQQGAVIILHPGTAVRERMYWRFAGYLVENGFRVITYNYRGVGEAARDPRFSTLRMRDWGDEDVSAVTRWALETFPGVPLLAVGHSLGGHVIGLGEMSDKLQGAVLIASHAGSIRLIRGRWERLRIGLVFRAIAPLAVKLLGYFPGRKLGLGEDIPGKAVLEWGRWVRKERYFFDDESMNAKARFGRVGIPLLSCGFDDDPWATPAAIDLLNGYFVNTTVERRQIDPKTTGTGPIGHLGFFKEQHRTSLWPIVLQWLKQHSDQAAETAGSQAGDVASTGRARSASRTAGHAA